MTDMRTQRKQINTRGAWRTASLHCLADIVRDADVCIVDILDFVPCDNLYDDGSGEPVRERNGKKGSNHSKHRSTYSSRKLRHCPGDLTIRATSLCASLTCKPWTLRSAPLAK